MTRDAAEDPSERLEVAEKQLKLMLEVNAGQTDKGRPVEGKCQLEEDKESERETVQRQHSGRKNRKGDTGFVLFLQRLL